MRHPMQNILTRGYLPQMGRRWLDADTGILHTWQVLGLNHQQHGKLDQILFLENKKYR